MHTFLDEAYKYILYDILSDVHYILSWLNSLHFGGGGPLVAYISTLAARTRQHIGLNGIRNHTSWILVSQPTSAVNYIHSYLELDRIDRVDTFHHPDNRENQCT